MSQAGIINVQSQSGIVETITGNDGVPESPVAGNFNIKTANATPKFAGSAGTETLDFGLGNLVLGSALPSNVSSSANVGLGLLVLNSITTGSSNTAIGFHAGISITSAEGATLVGTGAGSAITTSSSNTAVGNAALGEFTTGAANAGSNTAIGAISLGSLKTGIDNTCLGTSSGSQYTSSESSNICIGNVGTTGESNTIRIGTQGTGNGQQSQAFLAGVLNTSSGRVVNVTTPGAYPYTTLTTDYFIKVDTSSARTIIPLASPVTGTTYRIKDTVGSAAANNITITPSGKNIDGAASYVINSNYGSVDIVYNVSEWSVL